MNGMDDMKKGPSQRRPTRAKATVDLRSKGDDPRRPRSDQPAADVVVGIDSSVREQLSKHLHELLNSLWPAAARIELTIGDETCPRKFRETLELLRCSIEEAMTISARASALVDLPVSDLNHP
jgi:hypothetical protein